MEKKYTVDYKPKTYLFYLGLSLLVIGFFLIKLSGNALIYLLGIIRIVMVVLSALAAKELNRSIFFWAVFTFISPPIALMILGTRGIKFEGEKRKVYKDISSEFFMESVVLKRDFETGIYYEDEYKERLSRLLQEYDERLNQEMAKAEKKDEDEEINKVVEFAVGTGEIMEVGNKCPACGADLADETNICPECGLSFE